MSYCIDYYRKREKKQGRLTVLTIMSLFLFLLLVNARWPEGAELVRTMFRAAKDSTAVTALEGFAEELEVGAGVAQAFSEFFHVLLP